MVKYAIALVLAFTIGAACRWFSLPAPAPPMLQGAFLVVAMTLGFVSADKLLAARAVSPPPPTPAASAAPAGAAGAAEAAEAARSSVPAGVARAERR
jgi:XapX domain-containing protein